jgi:hypothetical protein
VRRRAQQALAVERDLARVRLVEARDQVEERRLAGAVRADQADDLALATSSVTSSTRHDPAEPPRHLLDREQATAPHSKARGGTGLESGPWTAGRRGGLAFGLGAGAVLWALGLVLAAFLVPD